MRDENCADAISRLLMKGIEEFNRGEFFEQHETLETVWRQESRPIREFYQGILQIGVACYQIERGNWPGAIKLFERGLRRLRSFSPECMGIDVARFIAEAERLRDEVMQLGPERLAELDRTLFPRILTQPNSLAGHG